jgi:EAL domain-containing protein (putative c-di-GMP-specific phosphodiesterase class I)
VALAPRDGTDPDDLLRKADVALYAAKTDGRNSYRIFDPQMLAWTEVRDQLELEMRVGIDCEEFVLHYQPIVDQKTRKVRSIEALVRWNHPQLGLMPPDRFIELAEETGLIIPLGDWIMRQACRDAATWPDHVAVAVNLSAAQFKNNNPLESITSVLAEAGLPARRLEVEVTESVLLGHDADCIDVLRQLRAMGVSVALDDFGTGYSSLTYLKRFPFDKIKIDRSFIRDIVGDSDSMTIVSGVCNMARGLNMTATAEGVETEDQFALLRIAGIDFAQGYLFGRPAPAEALEFGGRAGPALREAVVG